MEEGGASSLPGRVMKEEEDEAFRDCLSELGLLYSKVWGGGALSLSGDSPCCNPTGGRH